MSRRCACASLALAVTALAAAPALIAGMPIYKCLDNHLAVVYTDLPCKDGEQLDIRAGAADPGAVARLERERDQLDESAAQRMADQRSAARSWAAAWLPPAPEEDRSEAMAETMGYDYFVYPPFELRPPNRPRPPRPPETRGFAPNPPYIVPRQ